MAMMIVTMLVFVDLVHVLAALSVICVLLIVSHSQPLRDQLLLLLLKEASLVWDTATLLCRHLMRSDLRCPIKALCFFGHPPSL